MTKITTLQQATDAEIGTLQVNCTGYQPDPKKADVKMFLVLRHISKKDYVVIGGCPNGLEIFWLNQTVRIQGAKGSKFLSRK